MTQLPTYKNFDEKGSHFKTSKIETLDNYNEFIHQQKKSKGIYRGISSSKYKIYTSLQRQIITNDLKGKFKLGEYVNNFKRDKLLGDYFKTLRIELSKLSVYSYLQHYGAPTPFLDFTYNLEKALYFAIENFDEGSYVENGTIDDFFSIFYIDQSDIELIEIPEVIKGLKNVKQLSKKLLAQYEDGKDYDLIEHVDSLLAINTCKVFLLSHDEDFVDIYNTYNNIRILAQEGLFIHNDYDDLPLEEALKDFFIEAAVYQASELDDASDPTIVAQNIEYEKTVERNKGYQQRLMKNIIHCFEIRKNLIPDIRKKFYLSNADIYPDPEKVCKKIFEDSLPK